MNFDDKIKRALGKSKTSLPKFNFPKLNLKPKPKFGASLGMQKKWASFNSTKRNLLRKRLPDTDGDRVPNKFDCNPFNVMEQGVNKLMKQKIDKLPIYFTRKDTEYNRDAKNPPPLKKPLHIYKVGKKSNQIYNTIKKYPNLLKPLQEHKGKMFVDDISGYGEYNSSQNTIILGDKWQKMNPRQRAEIIFHELHHKKQYDVEDYGYSPEYLDENNNTISFKVKGFKEDYNTELRKKGYWNNKYEKEARYEAGKKIADVDTSNLSELYKEQYANKRKTIMPGDQPMYHEEQEFLDKDKEWSEYRIKKGMEELDSNQVDMEELRDDILEGDLD